MKANRALLIKKIGAGLGLISILILILYDARTHFDESLIHSKRQHKSAQKNWNIFYDQRYVFADSGFRYEADFQSIEALVEPHSAVFSDISTSYYASTYLPVYVKNIHRHHGLWDINGIASLLKSRQACYLQDPNNITFVARYFKEHNALMRSKGLAQLRYIIVNRDVKNLNLRQDCLWTARERLIKFVGSLAELKFEGEYLNFYEIKQAN